MIKKITITNRMKQNTLKVIFWLDENIMENTENSKSAAKRV